MVNIKKIVITVLAICTFGIFAANATAPRWVRKGTEQLNKERSNQTYKFVDFNTHDVDKQWLLDNATNVLKDYVDQHYAPQRGSIEVLQSETTPRPVYIITYRNAEGKDFMIEAMLVDQYMEFDDFEISSFQWEYYQLYAISMPNVKPLYDRFELTEKYNGVAVVKSLVPGLGQIYKGQNTKGYVFMGGEIFLVGATAVFEWKRRDADKMVKDPNTAYVGSWRSKRQAWQNFEIGGASSAILLYISNLIDAAVSKGARQVKVDKAYVPHYTVAPFATPDGMGMSLLVTF